MNHLRYERMLKATDYKITRALLIARIASRIIADRKSQIAHSSEVR